MAAKATIQDVLNEGFQAVMFGSPATFATGGGIVDTIVSRAGNWTLAKVGATNYAAATGYALDCLVRAEIAYASQALWIRRIAFLDGAATISLDADKKAALLKTARDLADEAQSDSLLWLGEAERALGIDASAETPGVGTSTGMIETGAYPQTVRSARNFGAAQ